MGTVRLLREIHCIFCENVSFFVFKIKIKFGRILRPPQSTSQVFLRKVNEVGSGDAIIRFAEMSNFSNNRWSDGITTGENLTKPSIRNAGKERFLPL
jgi:hypothetical protein